MAITLTDELKSEYGLLFETCALRPERTSDVDAQVGKMAANETRYQAVAHALGGSVPWYVIAVIHNMEASLAFNAHLHNGDPLSARTVHVPAGKPAKGNPPFTWEASAADALEDKKWGDWDDWGVGGALYKIEAFNGWGYRNHHPNVLTPYLWSYSNHYASGKFVADDVFSSTAVSKQCGAAVLLKRMAEKDLIDFGVGAAVSGAVAGASFAAAPILRYSATDDVLPHAADLQTFLNTLPGNALTTDGKPGKKTSEAFQKATGHFLKGDPLG